MENPTKELIWCSSSAQLELRFVIMFLEWLPNDFDYANCLKALNLQKIGW